MTSHGAHATRWLAIVGLGEDGVEGLTPTAKALISNARLIYGGKRHLDLLNGLGTGDKRAWPSPIRNAVPEILAHRGEPVAVLASGDPFHYGIGATLARHVPPEQTICVPAPSSLSLACARLGWPLEETGVLSLCGRPLETLAPMLQPQRRILALSADAATPAAVARFMTQRGFGASPLHVLEGLGGARERIRSSAAAAFGLNDVDALNLVAIEVVADSDAKVIPLAAGLPDDCFEHDGQITKQEIRAVTLSALAPRAGGHLWDVGCGSGSVAIEWLLRHPANSAVGIERDQARAARAARNAVDLGVPRLHVVTGEAPAALPGGEHPNAVFIGGGCSAALIDACWAALAPHGRMVANAVTLETGTVLIVAQDRFGGTLKRLSVERLDTIGGKKAFRPAITVTQWSAHKP